MSTTAPTLVEIVVQRVVARTGRRVKNLSVEFADSQGSRVVLRGQADSYHVKQLAQHAAREALPHACVENAILVD
jgi:hypothetical protein